MRVLILTFYFRPDLSAGSFRTTSLVDALIKLLPQGAHIDVITTLPNRYHSFTAEAPEQEARPGLSIDRIVLPKHRSGMLDQSKAFLHFAREAGKRAAKHEYDLVFATSSRLMTAVLGAWIARRQDAIFYLDIRDLLVDNIRHIASPWVSWVAKPILSALEGWAIRRAAIVNLVSAGFGQYFATRYPGHPCTFITNGIDEEFLSAAHTPPCTDDRVGGVVHVLYAGNIGEGQGLHVILPQLARRMNARIRVTIIGDGGRRQMLIDALAAADVTNVELTTPVERDALIQAYHQADVLFLHLNAYESFERVLPSKLFEYAAMRKPVWAGVSGYAAEFIRAEIPNSAVFPPCDVDAAIRAFDTLTLRDTPRDAFVEKYARSNTSSHMAKEIVTLLEPQ